MTKNKFGSVILQKESSTDGTTLENLKGVQVSNVDLKWYDNNGNLHELFEHYIGKPVSLQFTFSVKDKNDQVCKKLMTLLLPDKLGHFPGPNREVLQEGPRIIVEMAYRSGYSKYDIEKSLANGEAAGYVSLCGAGKAAGNLQIHIVMLGFFVWDDFLDKTCPRDVKGYKQLSEIIDYIVDIIRGKTLSYNAMSQATINVINKHKGYFEMVRLEALRAADKWNISPAPFLKELEKYLQACKLEVCLEWNAKRNKGSVLFHRVQKTNRELTIGIYVLMEAFALADGIHLSESIRDNLVLQTFRSLIVEHVAKANDLASFQKEYANGEVSNNLYLLHVEQELSMEESLIRMEQELNSITVAVLEAREFLVGLHPGQLDRYLEMAKAIITGNLLWCSYSQRYRPCPVYDVIVF